MGSFFYTSFSVVGLILWLGSSSILVTGKDNNYQIYDYDDHILSSLIKIRNITASLGYNDTLDEENEVKHRAKRNLICALRLQNLIPGLFVGSLDRIHERDPMDLGDIEDSRLYDGVFRGLSTLTNETAINVECDGDIIVISTTLGMNNAEARYTWRRRLLYEFSGYIWTRARKVEFAVEIVWDTSNGLSLDVTDTLVTQLDGFRFGFSGLWLLNPVVSGVVNILSRLWSGRISDQLADMIQDALNTQLSEITLPFG